MLGEKIRDARKERGMTLADLAEKIDVTPGHISQIERNMLEPSMTVLRKLSEVLGIPLPVLFNENQTSNVAVVRKNKHIKIKIGDESIDYELLSPLSANCRKPPNMGVVSFRLEPECWDGDDLRFNSFDVCMYVTTGALEFHINDDIHRVAEKECIYIPENTGYRIYNSDDREARGICVQSPPSF